MDEDVRGLVGHVSSDKGGGVPYAHVFFMHGKDTIRLTCDALGCYFWKTSKMPQGLTYYVMAPGYKTFVGKVASWAWEEKYNNFGRTKRK